MTLLIGSVGKRSRAEMELGAKVIVATPQTIANDLKSGAFSLDGFGVAIFDECHRAVGKYAYTYIANELAVRGRADRGPHGFAGKQRRTKIERARQARLT